MSFDPTKPVMTRDGRPARIICTDRDADGWSIVALVKVENDVELLRCYRANGSYLKSGNMDIDLVNVPTKRTGWINIYKDKSTLSNRRHTGSTVYATKEEAILCASLNPRIVATMFLEWEE